MVLIAIITNGWFLIALTPLASLGVIGQPALTALMSDKVDEKNQGSLQGVIASLTALSMIVTPLSMTWILSQFSNRNSEIYFPGAPFMASAALLAICVSVLDYFGPWPWYIIVSAILALLHFYLFYYVILFISQKLVRKT